MRLLESKKGLSSFAFEHSEEYQQTQHKFLAAVESMEPNNIVVRVSPRASLPSLHPLSYQAAPHLDPSLQSLGPQALSPSVSSDPCCTPGSQGWGDWQRVRVEVLGHGAAAPTTGLVGDAA